MYHIHWTEKQAVCTELCNTDAITLKLCQFLRDNRLCDRNTNKQTNMMVVWRFDLFICYSSCTVYRQEERSWEMVEGSGSMCYWPMCCVSVMMISVFNLG